jgi:glycosyltransferase involved in cell wall biosynthesis
MNKKILIDCRFWGPLHTGLGRYTKNLVENILSLDKKNKYTLLFQKKDKVKFKENDFKNVKALHLDIPHYSFKEQALMPLFLKKLKPDLVHFPHFNIPLLYNARFVATIHDLIKHESRGIETTTRTPLAYMVKYTGYKLVFKKAVTGSLKIIVPSKKVKSELGAFYPQVKNKTEVIYEGAGRVFKEFKPQKIKTAKVLQKFRIKKPYFIYTGNVYPHKNISRLLFAFKKLLRDMELNFVIVCSRDIFYQRLLGEVKSLKLWKNVFLTGFVKDEELVCLYSQAQMFITPSLMEGFGLPGLEAMSVGCPVLASNIPVFREVYGQSARFFNPEDIDSIYNAIKKFLSLPEFKKKSLLKKGKKKAEQYSWKETAQNTLNIYESCFSI